MDFLTRRIGPLPVVAWVGLGLVVVVWVRARQNKAPAQLPSQSLNPDYGPGGWPGQGSLGSIPMSAISQTAFQPPTTQQSGTSYGNMPGTSTPYPYSGGAGNPLNREAGTLANNPTAPFLPR